MSLPKLREFYNVSGSFSSVQRDNLSGTCKLPCTTMGNLALSATIRYTLTAMVLVLVIGLHSKHVNSKTCPSSGGGGGWGGSNPRL